MQNNLSKSLAIIVRASGESTTHILLKQLEKQITIKDCLHVLDEEECFEDKLKHGFELGLKQEKTFTVFIDADILLRKDALKKIRKLIPKLSDTELGFGLRLWDKFYDRPKFRGLHVYRTELLKKALQFIPEHKKSLRPETYVKQKCENIGFKWRNDISLYVAGIHDYFQKPDDIYYKFLIRSKRSESHLKHLKQSFRASIDYEFKIALKGIEDGERLTDITNNKFLYANTVDGFSELNQKSIYNNESIDRLVILKLLKHYKLNQLFWKSI
ncbi:hypothetical protein [Psychroserpens sp. MEBiC05023]